jgi:transcriptional regulator with XRE-family HTH domain
VAQRRTAFAKRRKALGFTQESLASALRVDASTVQNWEAGRHPPQAHVRRRLAAALRVTEEELDRLLDAENSARPEQAGTPNAFDEFEVLRSKLAARFHQLQDNQGQSTPEPDPYLSLPNGTPISVTVDHASHELDALLLSPLGPWTDLDNQLGPASLRTIAAQHFALIESYLDDSRGSDFRRIAYIAGRHAEFSGWLAQDSGDYAAAMRWTDAALEAARLIDDREFESYVLMRKSNIASDQRSGTLAVALADASWHAARPTPGPLQALALRQRAHALAVTNEASAALRALEDAHQQLAASVEPSSLTAYCTTAYLHMESAACLVGLGQASDAIPILESGLGSWAPRYRRDLGLCLARLALAYAHTREAAVAASIAAQAARIARATKSHRTTQVLRQVTSHLGQLGFQDRGREVEGLLSHTPTD